ncbi:MAG: OadG family transporter subunit [Bacteroidales bacterium]|nr:OadG family transporter subunit [Bacteroidales bacterium]
MKRRLIALLLAAFAGCVTGFAQNVRDLIISEAQTDSVELDNGYGQKAAWIELFNTSNGSVKFGGCFLTNDRNDLRRYLIPKNDLKCVLGPRQSVLFFADGDASKGSFHCSFILKAGETVYLVSNDGRTIVDSLCIPAGLEAGMSIAKFANDPKAIVFDDIHPARPTPGSYHHNPVYDEDGNILEESKAEKLMRTDPHGFTLTLVAVGVVFLALVVLYLCYTLVGAICTGKFRRPEGKKAGKKAGKAGKAAEGEIAAAIALALRLEGGNETEAAIALALDRYLNESVHDNESYVITIRRK